MRILAFGELVFAELAWKNLGELAAHHEAHDIVLLDVGPIYGRNLSAVLQHGDRVRQLHDLGKAVRDEENGATAPLQTNYEIEQPTRVRRAESGGRLVEDDDPRVECEGLDYLDELLLFEREVPYPSAQVHAYAVTVENLLAFAAKLGLAGEQASDAALAEPDILIDR